LRIECGGAELFGRESVGDTDTGRIDPPPRAAGVRSRSAPIIERAPLPSVEVQGSTHVVSYVNPAFCSLIGKTKDQLMGLPFAEIVPAGDECVAILDAVYQTGQARTHAQADAAADDPAHWLYAMWPALDANAHPVGVIIQLAKTARLSKDVTSINEALLISALQQHELTAAAEKLNAQLQAEIAERKLAQAALQEAKYQLAGQADELARLVAVRTEKLRETIGELEAFSYSVAHDMRAPLRGMQGFARLLLDEHAGRLDADARTYLERIASSALRMDALIRDVLDYTNVLRSEVQLRPVDLDRLMRDIMATYPDWQPPNSAIEIEGTLPIVLGHEGLLTQCLANLLSNAVKFVTAGVTPRVRVWAEERPHRTPGPSDGAKGDERRSDERIRVWFEDDGIGIAPKDRERVFRMFERLNAGDESTGMGLRIARKAAERMGAHVGFESELGKGSKFWIQLQKG